MKNYQEKNKLLAQIRQDAIKILIERYRKEFDYLILELKEEKGYEN